MNVQEQRRLKKDSDDFQRKGFSFPGDFDEDLCLCAFDPLRHSPSEFPPEPAGKNPNQNLRIRALQSLIDVRGSSEWGGGRQSGIHSTWESVFEDYLREWMDKDPDAASNDHETALWDMKSKK